MPPTNGLTLKTAHSSKSLAVLLALLLANTYVFSAPSSLPHHLHTTLVAAKIPPTHAAFFVQRVDAGQALLTHNSDQPMNPASTIKLLTTYAALELLGPAYTWKTDVLATGQLQHGRLEGDLFLRGSGDPSLDLAHFWQLLRQLRAQGLTEIHGDIILDRSAFRLPPHNPAAFDNQPLRAYNVGADALLVNFNSLTIKLKPDLSQKNVLLSSDTPIAPLHITSKLHLIAGECSDWREKLTFTPQPEKLDISGPYPKACGEKSLSLAPWPANKILETLFRNLWQEIGGSFKGRIREGETPSTAWLVHTHESPALSSIVRDMNKWSNNVVARQIFLSLAPERPATPAAAQKRLEEWLTNKGVTGTLDNGAGLSRQERISATALGQILLAAWHSPVMPEMLASLPIAGTDGTLKKRLTSGPASGRAHLKTGYLDGVRALAGYVLDQHNRYWVVVGIINAPETKSDPLDALVNWVAAQ